MTIDTNANYTLGAYTYVNFSKLTRRELIQILEWRNNPEVSRNMNTTEPISLESHLMFCDDLRNHTDKFYWLIKRGNEPVGVLNIINVDYENETCESGFYMSSSAMNRGEGIFILSNYKTLLLDIIQVKKIIGHNYYDNKVALSYTLFFGGMITDISTIGGRISITTELTKDGFKNGDGTKHLIREYVNFARSFDIDEQINDFTIAQF